MGCHWLEVGCGMSLDGGWERGHRMGMGGRIVRLGDQLDTCSDFRSPYLRALLSSLSLQQHPGRERLCAWFRAAGIIHPAEPSHPAPPCSLFLAASCWAAAQAPPAGSPLTIANTTETHNPLVPPGWPVASPPRLHPVLCGSRGFPWSSQAAGREYLALGHCWQLGVGLAWRGEEAGSWQTVGRGRCMASGPDAGFGRTGQCTRQFSCMSVVTVATALSMEALENPYPSPP